MSENTSNQTPKKPEGKKGASLKQKVSKFLREYRGELKKISWPTFPEVVKNSLITLAVVAIVGVFICVFDFAIGQGRAAILGTVETPKQPVVNTSASDVSKSEIINDLIDIMSDANLNVVSGSGILPETSASDAQ